MTLDYETWRRQNDRAELKARLYRIYAVAPWPLPEGAALALPVSDEDGELIRHAARDVEYHQGAVREKQALLDGLLLRLAARPPSGPPGQTELFALPSTNGNASAPPPRHDDPPPPQQRRPRGRPRKG